MNAIKDSIKSGRTVVGTTVTPNVDVSILADAGYDFLLFDTQHSAWELKQLQPSIQTMRGKQAAPLVRAAAKRGIAAGMYFIPPEMDPNFFVQKGFKFFTMPWGPWAKAGIQNGLSGIKR